MALRADEEMSVAAAFSRALRNLLALTQGEGRDMGPTTEQLLAAGEGEQPVSPALFRIVQLCALPEVLGESAGPVLYLSAKRFSQTLGLGSLQALKEWFQQVGLGDLEVELDDDKLVVKLSNCPTCHRLPNVGVALCDFERGLIDGVLEDVTGVEVLSKETLCWGLGDTVCQFEAYKGDGVGYLYREQGQQSEVQLRLLMGIADQTELAVENLRLVRERKALETRDPLTGLYNFRHLREHAVLELARAARYGRHVTFVMIDLDDFGTLVERGGRDAGDGVIRHWSDTLRAQLRACDFVCRYGADEFLLVLPETAETQADAVLQRVLGVLGDQECQVGDEMVTVTAAAGVAVYPQDGQRVEELVAKAATTMYAVKAGGKGCVGFYGASSV
jgi:diguanylate cyclase (GGDEF)-like protein